MADDLKAQFLLDPEITFLNHGSFGACPRPVFETYQRWQRELERQPVEFLGRRAVELLAEARARLAAFLGIAANDLVYFPNPTTALNMVIRSLDLRLGDEILTTDHEYGALDRTWRFVCAKSGAHYRQQHIPLPVSTQADFLETLWAGVNERTRVIFISHITSPTALIFPAAQICARARQAGLLTIVDGAHAPGQLSGLNLNTLGADVYAGACHKWLCTPKGSAFVYVRPELQARLEPLVVSWGWQSEKPGESAFIDYHEWQGTRDLAAFLSAPAALEFQAQHDWDSVRRRCHTLAAETRQRVNALTGLSPICPDSPDWFGQMFAARLPNLDAETFKMRLYDEFRIEAPVTRWRDVNLLRVSFQGYNSRQDADVLLAALRRLLPEGNGSGE